MKRIPAKLGRISLLLITLSLVLTLSASCGPSPTEESISDVSVEKADAVETIVGTEEFSLPNCGGTEVLEISLSSQTEIQRSVTIGAKATTSGGGEVGIPEFVKLKLEAEVELAYQETYNVENYRLDTAKMKAALGTHVIYVAEWRERKFESTVSYVMGDEVYRAPYTYALRVPKIVDSRRVSCETPTPPPVLTPPTGEPTATPTATVMPTDTPTPRSRFYDAFDDGCINRDLWHTFVDNQPTLTFLPTPVSQCWELADRGFTEHNDRIDFDHTNAATDDVRSFYLVEQPGRTFTVVELDLTVESMSGQWGGAGLFTRLNDADKTWAYYWLRFGGDLQSDQGRVVYEAGGEPVEGEPIFSLPATVTLELRWDGQAMHFYVNGNSTLQSVPFPDFSDTFGIYWVTGPGSSLKCHVDEFRVSWE
jgi:hypothetical protein